MLSSCAGFAEVCPKKFHKAVENLAHSFLFSFSHYRKNEGRARGVVVDILKLDLISCFHPPAFRSFSDISKEIIQDTRQLLPPNMTKRTSQLILIIGVSLLLIAAAFCGYKVHQLSAQQETIKRDYSIINNVSFGLLSVNKWRDQIMMTVQNKIDNFHFTDSQRRDMKKEIEQLLHSLVDTAVGMINKPQKTVGGKLKKMVFNALVDKQQIQAQVPGFAEKIMQEIEKPSSKKKLKRIASSKLREIGEDTYDSAETDQQTITDSIFKKYNAPDEKTFDSNSEKIFEMIRAQTYKYAVAMIIAVVIILGLWWVLRKDEHLFKPLYILSALSALVMLVVGVTSTMIELDARIKSIDFQLAGTTISFNNQVLFFQSKGILDVVKIMIDTGKWDMIAVGCLIFCFSILFPLTKLICGCVYLLAEKKRKNKTLEYFAFKSGKWSMADVTVVAIMMTYIGFNGVVQSQLASLNIQSETIASIATNYTSLQPAFIIFTGFVVYGLVLSLILKKITGADV